MIKIKAIKELGEVIEKQKIIYVKAIGRVLKAKGTISKKIRIINKLNIRFQSDFSKIIEEYSNIVCLFCLKQTSKELGNKKQSRLSPEINSWIKASADTITLKYMNEINLLTTLPIIDNIGRGLTDKELLYRISLLFNQIKKSKSERIISSIEGKAMFRGRDLAVKVFNKEIKLETFSAQSIDDILKEEKVVAAQWSAILDSHVCELCASLDGRIIDIESPDYAFYVPGEIHSKCRCMWVYIKSTERPENRIIDWKTPQPELLKKYSKETIKSSNDLTGEEKLKKDIEDFNNQYKQESIELSKIVKNYSSDEFEFEGREALEYLINKNFGIGTAKKISEGAEKMLTNAYKKSKSLDSAFVNMVNLTRRKLKFAIGSNTIKLYRGVAFNQGTEIYNLLKNNVNLKKISFKLNSFSSWTESKKVAIKFAKSSKRGFVMEKEIDIDNLLCFHYKHTSDISNRSFFKFSSEKEVSIFGGDTEILRKNIEYHGKEILDFKLEEVNKIYIINLKNDVWTKYLHKQKIGGV